MQFKYKLATAFAVFGLLILVVFAVQWTYLKQEANTEGESYTLDQKFSAESFLYGPQSWVPYASKLPLMPGMSVEANGDFYLMFVDLNATSNLNARFPCVRIDYAFEGLHGTAAFHIYGYIDVNQGFSWTNRVDGDGASGFYVVSQSAESSSLAPQNAQPMPNFDHIYVKVSNTEGAKFDSYGNDTYYMKFEKDGGGLNSLHITTNPNNPTGNVTTTGNQTGTFYVNYTGDRIQDDFVLLVAVNGAIGGDFRLNLKASVPT
jgi:hypothetical protein